MRIDILCLVTFLEKLVLSSTKGKGMAEWEVSSGLYLQ